MRTRGNYYVTALRERPSASGEVFTYADQVGRQVIDRKKAFDILDGLNERGYVEEWSEGRQQRFVVAERDEAGVWTSRNPFNGERRILDVQS